MNLTTKETINSLNSLAPTSFKELMAAILTLTIIVFYLVHVSMGREVPAELTAMVGASVGVWLKIT